MRDQQVCLENKEVGGSSRGVPEAGPVVVEGREQDSLSGPNIALNHSMWEVV